MMRNRTGRDRRRLALKRETLRTLSLDQLGRVAGGTSWGCTTDGCCETDDCAAGWVGTTSRFC
jgi:hypothetical protein